MADSGIKITPEMLTGGKSTTTTTPNLSPQAAATLQALLAALANGDYSKEAAIADSESAVAGLTKNMLQSAMPSIATAQAGSGLNNSTTQQLLINDLQSQIIAKSAALKQQAIKDYADIQTNKASAAASLAKNSAGTTQTIKAGSGGLTGLAGAVGAAAVNDQIKKGALSKLFESAGPVAESAGFADKLSVAETLASGGLNVGAIGEVVNPIDNVAGTFGETVNAFSDWADAATSADFVANYADMANNIASSGKTAADVADTGGSFITGKVVCTYFRTLGWVSEATYLSSHLPATEPNRWINTGYRYWADPLVAKLESPDTGDSFRFKVFDWALSYMEWRAKGKMDKRARLIKYVGIPFCFVLGAALLALRSLDKED